MGIKATVRPVERIIRAVDAGHQIVNEEAAVLVGLVREGTHLCSVPEFELGRRLREAEAATVVRSQEYRQLVDALRNVLGDYYRGDLVADVQRLVSAVRRYEEHTATT